MGGSLIFTDADQQNKPLLPEPSSAVDSSDPKKTLADAKILVEECFKEVQSIAEKEVIGPELDNFMTTVHKFKSGSFERVYKTLDGSTPPPPIFRTAQFDNRKKRVSVVHPSKNAQQVWANVVVTNKGILPRARYFAHSEQNIRTPDTLRLSHIPYVDDQTWFDMDFLEDLHEGYPEGIHGTSRGCGDHIDDFMMWKLLDITLKKWGPRDPKYIYKIISTMFPNKYSYQQLMCEDTRLTLSKRFEKAPPSNSSQKKGDDIIDGMCSQLCSKCLVFNCLSHPPSTVHDRQLDLPVLMPNGSERICGNECYLSITPNDCMEIPVLNSKFVLNMFRTFISKEYDLCNVAGDLNCMCTSLKIPSLQCREWYSLLLSIRQEAPASEVKRNVPTSSNKRNPQSQRERYKNFTNFLPKRNMKVIRNGVDIRPCHHPGRSCEDDNCSCFKRGSVCSKYCSCEIDCIIKFPGCTCSPGQCSSSLCACFLAQWECDPDTCLSCNCDASNPMESGSDKVLSLCRNINVQLKLQKKLKVGISTIPNAGNGCFLVGSAAPGDLISEYTGEVISHEETERRGIVYDKFKCSYVFDLSNEKALDAAKVGNLIRFANNDSKDPNCTARTIVVNCEQRIAVYANRHINDGEELFFDYNYKGDHRSFVGSSAVHKKKSKTAASTSSST